MRTLPRILTSVCLLLIHKNYTDEEFMKSLETHTPKPDTLIARVIFSEASIICSSYERMCVASVIVNRLNHPGFKKPKTLEEIVMQSNQFNCIYDANNKNWWMSEKEILSNLETAPVWAQCLQLSTGLFTPINKDIVMYHDKSIEKPNNWDNKWWSTHQLIETPHFKFYEIKSIVK